VTLKPSAWSLEAAAKPEIPAPTIIIDLPEDLFSDSQDAIKLGMNTTGNPAAAFLRNLRRIIFL
jgi:hypothetical protein